MRNLPFSLLISNELYTTSSRVVDVCKSLFSENSYISVLCRKIDQGLHGLAKGLGKALTSEFTPILLELDHERDKSYIGLRDYCGSYLHSNIPEKTAAGRLLSASFETVGNAIYNLGYAVESAKMNILILNLSTPEAQQALAVIGATEWFDQLKNSQERFERAYQNKIDVESTIDYPLVKDSRMQLSKYLTALFSYIEINSELEGEAYSQAEERINRIISDAVSIIRSRATRNENEESKEEKPEE